MTILHWSTGHWRWCFAIAGSAIGVYAAASYIVAIFRGEIRPQRTTWFVFFVGAGGGAWFTFNAGAGWAGSLGVITLAVLVGITWLISLRRKYGHKGLERWYHPPLVVVALLVYTVQIVTDFPPLIAALTSIAIDFSAVQIQWSKSWDDPESEEILPWVWGTIGGILILPAIAAWNFTSAAFPLYFVVSNLVIVGILAYKRPKNITPNKAGVS